MSSSEISPASKPPTLLRIGGEREGGEGEREERENSSNSKGIGMESLW